MSTGGRAVIAGEVGVTAVNEPLAAGDDMGDGDKTQAQNPPTPSPS